MPKGNKVLMLVENMPAPLDRRVWPEATALRDHGFQVSIISPKGSKEFRESYECVEGIHIYRFHLPQTGHSPAAYVLEYGLAMLMTFWLSLKVLFRHGFDVIHAANPPDLFFLIGGFYRLLGKKFVFDQHDLMPEMFQVLSGGRWKALHRLLLLLERWTYRISDLVIVTNASFKRFAVQRGGCAAERVVVVRNGPNLGRFKPVPPEPHLKGGRRYLLAYVGVIAVQDGVEYALYALAHLVHKRGRQDVSLVLLGDGENAAALRVLAHELDLDDYVNFNGWTEHRDILRYLSTADIGLVPDPRNGLNEYSTMIKTMEYMALGKPVVAFDLPETRFSAQDAGLYARPNVVEDFADNIETLLDSEELRRQMGAFGRMRVEEELSWECSERNLLLAYTILFPVPVTEAAPDVGSVVIEKEGIY